MFLVLSGRPTGAEAPSSGPSAFPALRRALSPLVRDESLSRAAQRHARALAAGQAEPKWTAVRAALRAEGLADAQVLPFAAFSGSGPELEILALGFLDERVVGRGYSHFGLAAVGDASRPGLAIFFVRRLVELPPLPSTKVPRALRGLLLTEASAVEGYFTLMNGEVERAEAERSGRSVRVRAPEEGEISALELIVHTARGPEVAINLSYRSLDDPSPATLTDAAGLERTLRELRKRHELPPLPPSPRLGRAAAEHASWVCEHRLAVHRRPDGQGPIERARRVGHTRQVLENVAIAATLAEAHQNLLESPSHRMNLLDPRATELGLGLVERKTEAGSMVCLVELFGADGDASSAQSGL